MKSEVMPRSRCQANSFSPASSRAARSARSASRRRGPVRRGGTSACRGRPTPKSDFPVSAWASKWIRPRGAGALRDRPDVRFGDRVVAPEDHREGAGVDDVADGPLDRLVRWPGRTGPPLRRRSRRPSRAWSSGSLIWASRWRPSQPPAARISRGPKRAPGRPLVSSSIGAPTTATSTSASVRDVLGVGQAAEREQARVLRSPGVGRALV